MASVVEAAMLTLKSEMQHGLVVGGSKVFPGIASAGLSGYSSGLGLHALHSPGLRWSAFRQGQRLIILYEKCCNK